MRRSFGASWVPEAAGRSDTRHCSSRRLTWPTCLGRWTLSLVMVGEPFEHVALGDAGLSPSVDEPLGFYVCVADLEDELIRSLGAAAVEQVLDAQGDLGSFRTFQKQPAWRGRTNEEQLRRFLGTHSGRKIKSAALLVHALDLTQVPRPLDGVLAHV